MLIEFIVLMVASSINAQKVKLKDVDVLTLYRNKMTNGRRSSPIPQLQCRGGTAGCQAFIPDVVQCYNRGSDGLETQWECKTEMPNEFKFGKIQVGCEGYDYPDDPYILAGSCGLEYTIDLTGVKGNTGHNSGGYSSNGWNNGKQYQEEDNDFNIGTLLFVMIAMFILYKAFFNPDPANDHNQQRQPPTNPDFIPPAGTTPPPPYSDASPPPPPPPYSSGRQRNQGNGGWSWGSFATGWGASSLFNSATRGNSQTRYRHHSPQRNRSRSRSRSSGGSSGTRTASGFGGTSRR
jgi:hypothetical protein